MALEGPEMLYYLKQHTVTLRAVDQSTTPSPRVTRILVPEKHRVMRKPC